MTKLLASYGFYPLRGPDDEGGSGAASGGGSTALTGGDDAGAAGDTGAAGGDNQGGGDGGAGEALYGKEGGDEKAADEGGGAEWKEYVDDPNKSAEENAAAKAEHDKTKPEGEGKEGKKEGEDAPVDPASYEFEVPENFELDPELDKEFRSFAAERKWSKEDVKALTEMQMKLYAKQSEQLAATVEKWGEDLKTDKEIGGRDLDANLAKARAVRREFFDDEAKALLDKSGLGNHPAFVRGFVRLGRVMSEAGTLQGQGKATSSTILENLYGSND